MLEHIIEGLLNLDVLYILICMRKILIFVKEGKLSTSQPLQN